MHPCTKTVSYSHFNVRQKHGAKHYSLKWSCEDKVGKTLPPGIVQKQNLEHVRDTWISD